MGHSSFGASPTKKGRAGELSPAPFVLIALLLVVASRFHVIQHPVPHYDESGDYYVGEQSCAEECSRDDEFVVHPHHPSAGMVSAQVSTLLLMASSENEVRVT